MTTGAGTQVTSATTTLSWDAAARVVAVRYQPHTTLAANDGVFLVEALAGWVGSEPSPFAVLADASGVSSTDAAYRATASDFFRRHRDVAFIALFNMKPAVRILTEMFRIGTGIPLKGFSDEANARSWLKMKGIAA
jgi:hypothetical protein